VLLGLRLPGPSASNKAALKRQGVALPVIF
jgi:hypothetical protein